MPEASLPTKTEDPGSVKPGEVFEQHAFSAGDIRDRLERLLLNIEEQRLVAWATWRVAPKDAKAAKKYEDLCKEQSRLAVAVAQWKKLNPEE